MAAPPAQLCRAGALDARSDGGVRRDLCSVRRPVGVATSHTPPRGRAASLPAGSIHGMADDRSITGSAATEASVHDDDELAEVLAAELERYSTGTVPVLPRLSAPAPREAPMQPLAVPRSEPPERAAPVEPAAVRVDDGAFARRAAEVERAMRAAQPTTAPVVEPTPASDPFRRADRPTGRRSATGPILQPGSLPTADDLPVKRRTGFRPPPTAADAPLPMEPLDRVLPTGSIPLPETTATLLDAMITGSIPTIETAAQRTARHAAPSPEPGPLAPVAPSTAPHQHAGPISETGALYEDWEQSLRAIGRPRPAWEVDDEIVPTGGDVDMATVALPVQTTGPLPWAAPESHRGAHALPVESVPVEPLPVEPAPIVLPDEAATRPRRSGRRRAASPEDAVPEPPVHRGESRGRADRARRRGLLHAAGSSRSRVRSSRRRPSPMTCRSPTGCSTSTRRGSTRSRSTTRSSAPRRPAPSTCRRSSPAPARLRC